VNTRVWTSSLPISVGCAKSCSGEGMEKKLRGCGDVERRMERGRK
jgi:hypothetical protein